MKRKLLGMTALLGGLLISGCNSQLVLERVVTNTPDPNIVVITVTPADATAATTEATAVTSDTTAVTSTVAVAAASTDAPTPTQPAVPTAAPTVTSAPVQTTPTLSPFPTETKQTIYIAQQSFEKGVIFWIQARKIMWVLIQDPNNPNVGQWFIYQDTFDETVDKDDPSLAAPPDKYVPRRGFGKLWSQTPGLRDALGWATTPEFGLNTEYKYQPGGYLDANNKYVPGPGTHFITTLAKEVYALSEPDPADSTQCQRPCIFGIRPGRISFREAVRLLSKHPLIYDMDPSVCGRVSGFCTFRVRMFGARGAVVAQEPNKDQEYVVQDVYLAFEHAPESPQLGDFVNALGTKLMMVPHYVDANNATGKTDPTCCSSSDLEFAVEKLSRFSTHGFTLYYPDQGLEVTDFADFLGANYALTPFSPISGLRVFQPYSVCTTTKFYWDHWLGFHTLAEYYSQPANACRRT